MFKFRYGTDCDDSKPCSSNKVRARIDTIINASKLYMDDLHVGLLKQIADNENCAIYYHKNCVSPYTSSSNTSKYTKDHPTNVTRATKKLRRSHTHSISSLTVCIVGKHVTYVRIQKIQIDGGRPICVDQLYRSRTKLRRSNTSLRSVFHEVMFWQKKYVAAWLGRYLTYMRPKLGTTGIACAGSLRTGCCQQATKVGP